MFMVRGTYPSEEEQYRVFRQIVEACRHTYVTLRLLDIGGDKPLAYVDFSQEMNPFLGWRGIRFLLSNIQLLEPHLRAILRTTSHGCVRILLPMVADLGELLATREVIGRVEKELRAEGVELGEYQLGVMLELPSTVWALPAMVPHIDFVSIGTNDLTQYTLAVDRGNERVSRWFRPLHPVVLRIVKHTADVLAGFPGKKLALCGEIAGSSLAAPFLVGSGLRELSMNPWKIPELRQTLARFTVTEAEELVARVLNFDTADQVEQELYRFAEDHGYTEAVRTGH
jgi:phosphotransferase system enzyme I (PtsI)